MNKLIKKTVIILIFILTISSIKSFGFFVDLNEHWSDESVYWATYEVRIFNGYPDGTLKPEQNITRAQYIALINRVLERKNLYEDLELNGLSPGYTDIKKDHWSYSEISKVSHVIDQFEFTELSIKDIFPGDRLYSSKKITRYEAALLARTVSTPSIEIEINNFEDLSEEHEYYKELNELINNGIFVGYRNRFRPDDYITRAEAATIMRRIYKDLDYLSNDYLTILPTEIPLKISNNFPLFFIDEYEMSENDRLFTNAVTSLEYKQFVGYIPISERHLYDKNPIKTIVDLRERGYHNVIGLNYYIIKYDKNLSYEMRLDLIEDTLESYIEMKTDYLDGIYNLLSYINNNSYDINEDLLILATKKYINSITESDYEKLKTRILLSEFYYTIDKIDKAKEVLHNLLKDYDLDIQTKGDLILKTSYLEYRLGGSEKAIDFIENEFSNLRELREFDTYSESLELKYVSFIKQILLKP